MAHMIHCMCAYFVHLFKELWFMLEKSSLQLQKFESALLLIIEDKILACSFRTEVDFNSKCRDLL